MEVRTYLKVREETARLGRVRQLLYDNLRAGKAERAPRTEETVETNSSNTVPMDVDALHREGGGKGKGKSKGDRNGHDTKCKGKRLGQKNRHFDGHCNECGEYGHQIVLERAGSSVARATSVEHMPQKSGLSCENDGALLSRSQR